MCIRNTTWDLQIGSDGCHHPYTHRDASDDNMYMADDDDLNNKCLHAV